MVITIISVTQSYDGLHVLLGLSNYLESDLPYIWEHCVNDKTTAIARHDEESLECRCAGISGWDFPPPPVFKDGEKGKTNCFYKDILPNDFILKDTLAVKISVDFSGP